MFLRADGEGGRRGLATLTPVLSAPFTDTIHPRVAFERPGRRSPAFRSGQWGSPLIQHKLKDSKQFTIWRLGICTPVLRAALFTVAER